MNLVELGEYYRNTMHGEHKKFIAFISNEVGGSYDKWIRRFPKWAKGRFHGRVSEEDMAKLTKAVEKHKMMTGRLL